MMDGAAPLTGLRVLVPRGGSVGARLSAAVITAGGVPTVMPMIAFATPQDAGPLDTALARLRAGGYDWLAVTSATTAEVLAARGARVPDATRIAAVGPATRAALLSRGFRVDFVPRSAYTASAMAGEWPGSTGRVLLPQSAIAEATLAEGLRGRGLTVDAVTAYQTRLRPIDGATAERLRGGGFDAVLATSGSVARAVAEHCSPLPTTTVLACIGENTANAAAAAGLRADVIAAPSGAEELVAALVRHIGQRASAQTQQQR